jgi:CBS domain-containing membrane protein
MEGVVMTRERRVLDLMSSEPRAVGPGDHVAAARREMELSCFRHFPVMKDGRLVGVVSHGDLVRAGADQLVRDVMSDDIKTVAPETPAHEAAYLILRHRIGCLPVVDGEGRVVGIVTDTDFVRAAYVLLGGTVAVEQLELEELEAERV